MHAYEINGRAITPRTKESASAATAHRSGVSVNTTWKYLCINLNNYKCMKNNNSTGNILTEKVPYKHFLRIMRTTFILLFTCVFCSMAEIGHSQNARVTIDKRNSTLDEVLNEIEKQTDYLFIYNDEVNAREKVSVRAKQEAVSEVLNYLLKDKDLDYSMEGNHIILKKTDKNILIDSNTIQQQKKHITGKVSD